MRNLAEKTVKERASLNISHTNKFRDDYKEQRQDRQHILGEIQP